MPISDEMVEAAVGRFRMHFNSPLWEDPTTAIRAALEAAEAVRLHEQTRSTVPADATPEQIAAIVKADAARHERERQAVQAKIATAPCRACGGTGRVSTYGKSTAVHGPCPKCFGVGRVASSGGNRE